MRRKKRLKPIPMSLLIHSITYHKIIGNNGWGGVGSNEYDEEGVTIKNVRVDLRSSFVRSGNAEGISYTGVLFVDSKHSKPIVDFKENSMIKFGGQSFKIKDLNPVYGFDPNIPHHYEIGLE